MHNSESSAFGTVNTGISSSPFTIYDVASLVPRPSNVSHDIYEKYKKILELLLDNSIGVDDENSSNVLYEKDGIMLVYELNNSMMIDPAKKNYDIFIVSLVN